MGKWKGKKVQQENLRNRKSNRKNREAKFKSVCLQRACHSMYANYKILIKHRMCETLAFSEISSKLKFDQLLLNVYSNCLI